MERIDAMNTDTISPLSDRLSQPTRDRDVQITDRKMGYQLLSVQIYPWPQQILFITHT